MPMADSAPVRHAVLVVEDDEALRSVLCRLLDEQGYHVLCAAAPIEAIELAADLDNRIDLLLTDVGLPGVSGYQLADVLLRMVGQLQVIFVSGTSEADIAEYPPGGRRIPHLMKPFTLEELLGRIREALAPQVPRIADAG